MQHHRQCQFRLQDLQRETAEALKSSGMESQEQRRETCRKAVWVLWAQGMNVLREESRHEDDGPASLGAGGARKKGCVGREEWSSAL
jgi:hypothetical protein